MYNLNLLLDSQAHLSKQSHSKTCLSWSSAPACGAACSFFFLLFWYYSPSGKNLLLYELLRGTIRRINTHTFHDYYPARKYVVILCCRNTSYNSGKHSQSPAEPRKAWILQADGRPQSQCVTPPQSVSETTPPTIRLYSPII